MSNRLRDGWTSHVDEATGATYFYNEETGQSQWETPQAERAESGHAGYNDYGYEQDNIAHQGYRGNDCNLPLCDIEF